MSNATLQLGHILDTPSRQPSPVSYTLAAFGTLLVYDYLCTLADEVSLVWSQSLNVGSIVYFLNRYLPFIDTFMSLYLLTTVQPPEVCLQMYRGVTWLIVLGVCVSEVILMIRTYAIFGRKRSILVVLCFLAAIILIPGSIVVHLEVVSLRYGYPPAGPYTGCTFTAHASPVISIAYLLVLFTETIIVALTGYKAFHHLRRSRVSLVVNLYRNGLLFYVYILIISLANVVVPFTAPAKYSNWLATPQRVFHSLLCTRLLLSILHDRKLLVATPSVDLRRRLYNFSTILPSSQCSDSMELAESGMDTFRFDRLGLGGGERGKSFGGRSRSAGSDVTLPGSSRGENGV